MVARVQPKYTAMLEEKVDGNDGAADHDFCASAAASKKNSQLLSSAVPTESEHRTNPPVATMEHGILTMHAYEIGINDCVVSWFVGCCAVNEIGWYIVAHCLLCCNWLWITIRTSIVVYFIRIITALVVCKCWLGRYKEIQHRLGKNKLQISGSSSDIPTCGVHSPATQFKWC